MKLAGKVSLVTGSGRGIGRAIALRLARLGSDVVITDVRLDSAKEYNEELTADTVMDEVRALGRRSFGVETDVTNKQMVESLLERVVKEFGRIDILVNNVGGIRTKRGELNRDSAKVSEEDLRTVMDSNLMSTVFCCQASIPHMIEQKSGAIINMASRLGFAVTFGAVHSAYGPTGAYASAKAAVIQYTRVLAAELGPHGIRVNCIAPGVIETSRQKERARRGIADSKGVLEQVPLQRLGEPEDIAKSVEFLCTDLSDYITGQVIRVDGGRSLF